MKRTAAEEHRMAMISAYDTLQRRGTVAVKDVVQAQGLAEIRAKRALEDLVKAGKARKSGHKYTLVAETAGEV